MNIAFYDVIGKRYFESNYEKIGRAINKVNRRIFLEEGRASLNELYEEMELKPIENGDDIGWIHEPIAFHHNVLTDVEKQQNYISIEFIKLRKLNEELWF